MSLIYVSWDGDSIGARAGLARMHDDIVEVRRVSQAIDAGNEIWKSFALSCGGQPVEAGGDEGAIEIPVAHLAKVPDIARQYSEAVGATVSVGVGMTLSTSSKALLIAKLRGKDQTVLWAPEMQAEIDAATSQPKTEAEKLDTEYLSKATGGNEGAHAGFSGHTQPTVSKPTKGQSDHSAAAVTEGVVEGAPDQPEQTHAAADFEDQMHSAAQDQESKDRDSVIQDDAGLDQLKKRIVSTLTQVKAQMPLLAQLQQASPETYQTVMNLVQGLILLGKQVMKQQPAVAEDEDPQHVQEELSKSVAGIQPGPKKGNSFDYSHVLPEPARQAGISMHLTHAPANHPAGEHMQVNLMHQGQQIGNTTGYIRGAGNDKGVEPHSELESTYRGKGLGQAMHEATYAHAKNVLGVGKVQFGPHSEDAHRMLQSLAQKHGFAYQAHSDPKLARYGYGFTPGSYVIKSEDDLVGPDVGAVFFREEVLEKTVAQIQAGKRSIAGPGRLSFDYSHALPEEHRNAGMSLKVTHVAQAHPVEEHTVTTLNHGGKVVGSVTAYVRNQGQGKGIEPHSMLLPKYQGKGLGQAMYEATYAHAKNALGISQVEGGPHSPEAHKLHTRLAAKHGFQYSAPLTPELAGTDYPHMPYSYAIKDEMSAAPLAESEFIGPGKGITFLRAGVHKDEMDGSPATDKTLDKAAGAKGGIEGHPERSHLKLPPGSVVGNKIKVTHADGKTGWVEASSGQVQGQEPDAPLMGANSHPVSARKPSAR